ncbi:hypothetical protein [Streptomyces orinoci]|uniref:ATP-binding protein n=1 Tax=Streptomyces orinoci TaxID=67339 RepID=A0ABV3JSE9_STRON|nr:hypothetical protein [Streptomyces orinoci]
MPVSLCPLANPHALHAYEPAEHPASTTRTANPTGLAYSFTVPGEPRSAALARAQVRTALRAHGLADAEEAVLQTTGELVACASLFEPGQNLYLSLHWRDRAIRTVLWDPHPSHAHDRAAQTLCTARRKRILLLLACVVRECGGTWGIDRPSPGNEGTKVWANLPHTGAKSYAVRRC